MSLEELRKSLLQEAKAEGRRVTSDAQAQAEEKLSDARAQAKSIVSEATARAHQMAAAEKNGRQSAAQLKAKKITSEAQNKVLVQGIEKIWKEFEELPSQKAEYEKLLKRLISHAEKEIGKGAVVMVNQKDQPLAKKHTKNVSGKAANIAGGAIVSSADGSISVDVSLESLFSQKEEDLRKLVYSEIFGGKKK